MMFLTVSTERKNVKKTYGKASNIWDGSKPWYLVNPKIAGKWMFIPLKMYL
jgi:hypothetical protein